MYELLAPVTHAKGTTLTFTLDQRFGGSHTIGKFRLSVSTTKPPLSLTVPAGRTSPRSWRSRRPSGRRRRRRRWRRRIARRTPN